MKKKLAIFTFIILTLSFFTNTLFRDMPSENTSDTSKELTTNSNTTSIVNSLNEMNISVQICDSAITVSSILSEDSKDVSALVYKPSSDINVIPSYITPSEVLVDMYDSFILIYKDKTICDKDFSQLEEDSNTIFVQRLEDNNVYINTTTSNTDTTNLSSDNTELSYAPSLMNSRQYSSNIKNSGRKITVVIMDTGLYSTNSKVIPFVNLQDSYDFVNNDNNVLDNIDEHATLVTSTFLDIIGKNLIDNVNIINAKVLENGMGSNYTIYTAIMHYVDEGNVDIINCSFGSPFYSPMMEYAYNYAAEKGIKIICASGNEYSSSVCYPAAYDSTICVGAINELKLHADFSNTGEEVDFVAPGVNVLCNSIDATYDYVSGTSIAAPCISGYSVLSMLDNAQIKTKDDLINHLKTHCLDLGDSGKDNFYGNGLPRYTTKPTPTPTVTPTKTPSTQKPIISKAPTKTPVPTATVSPTLKPTISPTKTPIESKEPDNITPTDPPATQKPTQKPTKTPTKSPSNDKPIESEAPSEEPTKPPKIMVSFDTNGGINNSGQTYKYVTYKGTYGELPELKRDYYTFEGWYTSLTGGEKITSSTYVTTKENHTIYAHWKSNNISGWVKVEDMPADAKVADKKWTYVLTSYKESNSSNMPGWTLYNSSYTYSPYGSWSNWTTTPLSSSELRKVESKYVTNTYETGLTEFNYSHYKYWNTTYNNWYYTYSYEAAALHGTNISYHELGWSTTEQFLYTKFGNSYQSWGTYVNGLPFFNEVTRPQTRTETIKYYRYSDRSKIYTYYFKKSENKESSTKPSGNNISNIQMYVRYIPK